MDREQEEMQFLGIWGIYTEAYKVIFSWRKIFSQITLALILPLTFIFLAHIEASDLLFTKIVHNEYELDHEIPAGTAKHNKVSDLLSSEWTTFWLFKALYYTFFLIFSLLSTSAVVYTVACIYTSREVTFNKVMSVVPKVWKRLMVTSAFIFIAFFAYYIAAVLILILWAIVLGPTKIGMVALSVFLVFYLMGFVYMFIVWQLASVITVLEEAYGIQAMVKSRALIRGKAWVAIIIFFMLNFTVGIIQVVFEASVVHGKTGMMSRIVYGIICFLLLFKAFLFGLVVQTVFYFVCKSYHHENIDKSMLSDHLEVYLGEYVPLKTRDVQLEHFGV